MPNVHQRIAERILRCLERVGPSPLERLTLLRDAGKLGDSSAAVSQALQMLVVRGEVRRVGDLYIRLRVACPKPKARERSTRMKNDGALDESRSYGARR